MICGLQVEVLRQKGLVQLSYLAHGSWGRIRREAVTSIPGHSSEPLRHALSCLQRNLKLMCKAHHRFRVTTEY